ncbi:MAG TPA: hypothetical protein PLO84_10790 [Thermotogota bacterium]|nr:hypothetical protein [Thermotogota bacterium]
MIKIYGLTNRLTLTPDKYEEDTDVKVIENESYTGVIYREIKKVRKRFNLNAVIDEEEKAVLEALEAEGTVSFVDMLNKAYTGYIQNLKFQRIAGVEAYTASFMFRGWLDDD